MSQKDRFMNTFRGEMKANINEFGKRLWETDSDVFIFMARKAACFFDCLRELKIADVRGIAVSDRILDMDLTFLIGKKVTLVDDCVFTGTTIYHARNIVMAAGAGQCDTLSLSVNEECIRPALLPGGTEAGDLNFVEPLIRLDDSQSVQQCYDVVRAISIFPRPYDVDFPHTLTSKLSEQDFDQLVHCTGWQSYDVSSQYQISQNVRAFTLVPDLHIQREFLEEYDGLNSNIQAAKVRIYARRLSSKSWSVRMVPMVVLGVIQKKVLESNETLWGPELATAVKELGAVSAKSRYRLLHFLVSWALLKRFSMALKDHYGLHVEEKLRSDLAEMSFGSRFSSFSANALDLFQTVSLPPPVAEPESSCIAKFGEEVTTVENPQELVSACLEPFTWLYRELEVSARRAVFENGLKACLDGGKNDLTRLGRGFSPQRLIRRLQSTSFDIARYVSLFLDKAIDLGIAVPTVVDDGGVLYRAFRHGEDAVFGEAEERLTVIALQAYMENREISIIYGLELQKFVVLFVQIAVRDGALLERLNTSESVNVGCRVVTIKGHLHGPVPMVATLDESGTVGAPFVSGNDYPAEWLVADWERKGILTVEKSGSLPFAANDLKDLLKLVDRLRLQPDAVSAFVFNQLDAATQEQLKASGGTRQQAQELESPLIEGLNVIVRSAVVWDAVRFKDVKLRSMTEKLLRTKPAGANLARLNRLLIEDAFRVELKGSRSGTKYSIGKVPDLKIGLRKESQARKIGRCLGRLVRDKNTSGTRPLNNDTDLVLLSTCSEAEHQMRALSGELSIALERWSPTMKQIREKARDSQFADASETLLEVNSLYVAINSGAMKYRWFVEQQLAITLREVSAFADTVDPTGDLRDDWNLLWPESASATTTGTAPSVQTHITAMGQWLITASVTLRLLNYWLVTNAEANGQLKPGSSVGVFEDCLKWCRHFVTYCNKVIDTPFGQMVTQLLGAQGPTDIHVINAQCKLAAEFMNDSGRRAIRHLLSDSRLLCESYGMVGEFRPFQYAVFFDVEKANSSGDPYAKVLRLAADFIDHDTRLIEAGHNPWRAGLWVAVRGNRSSIRAAELCHQLVSRCNASKLRFRAVLLGQLAYDDSIRDMAGSVKIAEGDFFRRIADLRSEILPKTCNNLVVFVNEITTGSISEGQKFCEVAGVSAGETRIIRSGNEELPEKSFLVTSVNAFQNLAEGEFSNQRVASAGDAKCQPALAAKDLFGKVDVGIITIREDEFEAVLNRFPERRFVTGTGANYQYAEARTKLNATLRVAISRSPEQGEGSAQAIASSMIADLEPQWIFVVGIAGGLPAPEYTLGDVLLSQRMHDFAVSAAVEGKAPQFQDMGGPMVLEVEKLVTGLKGLRSRLEPWNEVTSIGKARPRIKLPVDINSDALYGSEEWRKKVLSSLKANFSDKRTLRGPDFFAATIIASNTLVKDTALASQWQQTARHASAVEMELGGVCRAARYAPNGNIKVLAIRGLSDIVGYKRSHEWTDFACRSAAAFAEALIKSGLIQTGPIPSSS